MARVEQDVHARRRTQWARVSVPTSMVRDDGQTEAVPVRERRGTGSARGRRGASLPAEYSRWADAAGVRRGSGTGRHGAKGGRLAGPRAKRGEGADRGVSGQEQAGEPQGATTVTAAQGRRGLDRGLGGCSRNPLAIWIRALTSSRGTEELGERNP